MGKTDNSPDMYRSPSTSVAITLVSKKVVSPSLQIQPRETILGGTVSGNITSHGTTLRDNNARGSTLSRQIQAAWDTAAAKKAAAEPEMQVKE